MYQRYATQGVEAALRDTRVVLLVGPRQAGKTTLVRALSDADRRYMSLDDAATRALARSDPVTFVRNLDCATLDEVQRAPDLLLAIKQSVDTDGRPGRFLLTGSANLMSIATVGDSLAGRMEIVPLLPLAQAEILGNPSTFLAQVFAGVVPQPTDCILGQDLVQRVFAGGYPEAVARRSWDRRHRWHVSYLRSIIERDVQDIAQVGDLVAMPRLLHVVAHYSAQLVNYSTMGSTIQMSHKTAKRYLEIFEKMHLIKILPSWSVNRLNRLVKAPKLHFIDTGSLAALLDLDPQAMQTQRKAFGPILETFVFSEVLKLCGWYPRAIQAYHFRDKDQKHEVDIVLEGPGGAVVGLEVKAAATASPADFRGLKQLQAACGERFKLGLLLYDHDVVLPFADKLFAAPISSLWI